MSRLTIGIILTFKTCLTIIKDINNLWQMIVQYNTIGFKVIILKTEVHDEALHIISINNGAPHECM